MARRRIKASELYYYHNKLNYMDRCPNGYGRVIVTGGPSPAEGCFLMAGGFVREGMSLRKPHTTRNDAVPGG